MRVRRLAEIVGAWGMGLLAVSALLPGGPFRVAPAGAAGGVVAELTPRALQVGEYARLTVTVEGATDVDSVPVIPEVPGLTVRAGGQQTNISIVNGAMSRSITFEYVVRALKAGDFVIAPIEVRVGREVQTSQPLPFKVVAAGTAPPAASGTDVPDDSRPEAAEEGQVFVRAIVDRGTAYVGQQITLRFQFYQASGFTVLDSRLESPPETPGFWREEMPPQRTFSQVVDGRPYRVTEILYALFPTQTGSLEIGPGVVECVVRDPRRSRNRRDPFSLFGSLFEERRVQLRSRPVRVQVEALPSPAPEDFTGGVGTYRLRAELDRAEIPQNESTTLKVTVEGRGNVSAVGEPSLDDLREFRAYSPISEVVADTQEDKVGGKKEFKIVLVPQSTGTRVLPPVELSYFDPLQKRYRRLTSDSLRVRVLPATAGVAGNGAPVERVGWDLREIRDETSWQRMGDRPWRRGGFWLAQGVPVLLLGAALLVRRRREHETNNADVLRSRRAPKRLLADLEALSDGRAKGAGVPPDGFQRLQSSLERALADRFHAPVVGRSRAELHGHLRTMGMTEEAWARLSALLERCDFARFASQAVTTEDLQQAVAAARGVAADLEAINPPPPPRGRRRTLGIRLGASVWCLALGGALVPAVALAQSAGPPGIAGKDAVPQAAAESTEVSTLPADFGGVRDLSAIAAAFTAANRAYRSGRYPEAIAGYQQILEAGFESPALYLNLGNAHYRAGHLGWAVHAFERGRRMAPRDPDLRTNLQLAQRSVGGELDAGNSILGLLAEFQNRVPLTRSVWILTGALWAYLVWLAIRVIRPRPGTGVRMSGVLLGVVAVLCAGWTAVQALQVSQRPDHVVVATTLAVHSNPSAEATVEFTLQEGVVLRSYRTVPGFVEVRFNDELRGWASQEGLAKL